MNPKKLFLIDGSGALLSAFLLGVVLVRFEPVFGMPRETLYFLAFLPCIFAVYDVYCYLRITKNQGLFLKIIAVANLVYCVVSTGLVLQHYQRLTNLGLAYFVLEIIVVIVLAMVELKTASGMVYKKVEHN